MQNSTFSLDRLNGINGFTIQDRRFVKGVGDLNADGFDDTVVVNPSGNKVTILWGNNDDVDPFLNVSEVPFDNKLVIQGVPAKKIVSIGNIGDLNNDGVDDLTIGLKRSKKKPDTTKAGYVIYGQRSRFPQVLDVNDLPSNQGLVLRDSDTELDAYPFVGIGDINGDGLSDIAVSDPGQYNYDEFYGRNGSIPDVPGRTYFILGKENGFATDIELSSLEEDNQGFSLETAIELSDSPRSVDDPVVGIGDINGDGFDDVFAATNHLYATPHGGFWIWNDLTSFHGSQDGLVRSRFFSERDFAYSLYGIASLGQSIDGRGDFNGDGFDDVIVGSPFQSDYGSYFGYTSESYVLFGSKDGLVENIRDLNGGNGFQIISDRNDNELGGSVRFSEDINGDGFDEVVIAESADVTDDLTGGGGRVYVIFGQQEPLKAVVKPSALKPNEGFIIQSSNRIQSIEDAGDINGDQLGDFWIKTQNSEETFHHLIFGSERTSGSSHRLEGSAQRDIIGGGFANDTILGFAGNDILKGKKGRDVLKGFNGDDQLFGGDGGDFLAGGQGRDRLIGGKGNDTLKGGQGKDIFVFQNANSGRDRILDFDGDEDRILLKRVGFEALGSNKPLTDEQFVVGSAAIAREHRIIYNDQTGELLFDSNGSRAGGESAIARLNPGLALSHMNIGIF